VKPDSRLSKIKQKIGNLCLLAVLGLGVWGSTSAQARPFSTSSEVLNPHALVQPLPFQLALQPERYRLVDEAVLRVMEDQGLVGLALGLVENGKISYLKGYGWADRENREAVTLQSSFRWASLSKPVTAVLSQQLVEQGLLDLDQDIQKYWKAYHNVQGWPLTQRQLLAHLAGIGSYDEVAGWQAGLRSFQAGAGVQTPAHMSAASQAVFAAAPLLQRPGLAYHYSTFGYMLAGAVLEQRSGQSYWQQFQERIAQPLGLTSIQPDHAGTFIPYRVSGYYKDRGSVVKRPLDDVAWKLAGGGFTSNIQDLTRFMQALIQHELISQRGSEALWTVQKTVEGQATAYGLGFGVSQFQQIRRIEHGGSQTRTRTLMSFHPDQKRGLVLMCNSEWAELAPLRDALFEILQTSEWL